MSDELLLGELTPEVKAFLESMGRTVKEIDPTQIADHRATKIVPRLKRESRHVRHDPPAWGPLMEARWPNVHQPARLSAMRSDEAFEYELGERVASAFRMQADTEHYLHTLPHQRSQNESEAA